MIAMNGSEAMELHAAEALQAADIKLPRAKKSVLTVGLLKSRSGRKVVDIRPMQLKTEKLETITDCIRPPTLSKHAQHTSPEVEPCIFHLPRQSSYPRLYRRAG